MFRIILLVSIGCILYYYFSPPTIPVNSQTEETEQLSSEKLVQDQIKRNFFEEQVELMKGTGNGPSLEQVTSDFVSNIITKTISGLLNTQNGQVFLNNLVGKDKLPERYSVQDQQFADHLLRITVIRDSDKSQACCGKLAYLEYKVYDEHEVLIAMDKKRILIGNSPARPMFDAVLSTMKEGQIIQSNLATQYIRPLIPKAIQSKNCRLVVEMIDLVPQYSFKLDDIKIFNENSSSEVYFFCSDRISCNISCKLLEDNKLLFEKNELVIRIGDPNLPAILNYALANKFVSDKRTIICPVRYLKSFSGQNDHGMLPDIPKNSYVVLEITKMKKKNND